MRDGTRLRMHVTRRISTPAGVIEVYVMPTGKDVMIAQHTLAVLSPGETSC